MKKNIMLVRILVTLLIGVVIFYFTLPAINLTSPGFYAYLFMLTAIYLVSGSLKLLDTRNIIANIKKGPKSIIYIILGWVAIFVVIIVINLFVSPLFNSSGWANRIVIDTTKSFEENVKEVDFNALPLLDKESSQKLGDRVMGQMPELVSQFYVSNLYTQINYNNDIVRVTPLEYNGFIKYLNNYKEGVKGYITVNSVTGDTKLVKLEEGMKYMPSAYFSKNLYRALRFKYPTVIFGKESFEIDNNGKPYWVVPTIKYTGIGVKTEISGVILMDAVTGNTKKYVVGDVPTWIDQVYSADLIIEQVDNWGMYKKGFFNSLFAQNGVVQTTSGYNYTVMNDDVYLYTGITSVVSDESNIGFIMTNLRTKETNFYQVPGAEEYSAMASAEGQVQQMKYNASFPLLINLNGRATYLISLKDDAGLVKMYAFVDVKDYQKVVVTDSSLGIQEAYKNYLNNVNLDVDQNKMISKSIVIKEINQAIIDGNTYYYILDNKNNKYKVAIKVNNNLLPFITSNDTVNIKYVTEQDIIEIKEISK